MRSKPLCWCLSQYNVFCKPTPIGREYICALYSGVFQSYDMAHSSTAAFPAPAELIMPKPICANANNTVLAETDVLTVCLAHPDVLADCILAQNATKQNISIYILHTPIRVRSMTIHLLVHRKATWWDLYKAASVASFISTNAGDLSDDALLNCCCCCWWTNE